jgi:acid stress-induced BolA-like protein IbaG/YrbA
LFFGDTGGGRQFLGHLDRFPDGLGSHYNIIAVSDVFNDMSRVKRQQAVYAPLADKIADGSMHAITIKTFSVKDWERERQFNIPQ